MGSARGYRLKSKCTLRENYGLKHFNTILNIYRSCYRIRILNLPLVSVPRIVQLHNSFPINEASFFFGGIFLFSLYSWTQSLCNYVSIPVTGKVNKDWMEMGRNCYCSRALGSFVWFFLNFAWDTRLLRKQDSISYPPGKKSKTQQNNISRIFWELTYTHIALILWHHRVLPLNHS